MGQRNPEQQRQLYAMPLIWRRQTQLIDEAQLCPRSALLWQVALLARACPSKALHYGQEMQEATNQVLSPIKPLLNMAEAVFGAQETQPRRSALMKWLDFQAIAKAHVQFP